MSKTRSVVISGERGQRPAPRFGHTATLVGDTRVVVFGGCLGDMKEYTITADAYSLDVTKKEWSKVIPDPEGGPAPSARAAHSAACVELAQLVVYGGATGGGSLVSDELHVLDFRNEGKSMWLTVPVKGQTPGRRYGHTMVFNKPLLIVCGGSVNNKLDSDIWILDVENSPFMWSEVNPTCKGSPPLSRVYHTAEVCREGPASGMMIVFGGRTGEGRTQRSLKDIWGLRQHRDRSWDWVEPKKGASPEARFQHIGICFKKFMLIIGGRGADVNKALPTCIYDTAQCEWKTLSGANDRFRTSAWVYDRQIYSFGGFDHKDPSLPTQELMALDLDKAFKEVGWEKLIKDPDSNKEDRPGPSPKPAPDNKSKPGPKQGVVIANQVLVASDRDFTSMVKRVAIDALEEEARKLHNNSRRGMIDTGKSSTPLADSILDRLLQPMTWQPPAGDNFAIAPGECLQLCDEVFKVFKSESMLLELRTYPVQK